MSGPTNGTWRRRWRPLPLLVFLAGLVVLLALSGWQWRRAEAKQHLLDQQAVQQRAPALSWAAVRRLSDTLAGRQVSLNGHFLPRYRVAHDNQIRQGKAGMNLYMAFAPEDRQPLVLVNLGWVPSDRQGGPSLPKTFPASGRITGHAVMPSRFITLGAPERAQDWWRAGRIEPAHWAAHWGLAVVPWVIDLSPDVPGGFLRDAAPRPASVISPDKHRGYAVQWLLLALTWAGCWATLTRARLVPTEAA